MSEIFLFLSYFKGIVLFLVYNNENWFIYKKLF